MDKISLDKLLASGDVIKIVDTTDADSGKFFIYRGRISGHNVLDEVGGDRNPVAVEHIPTYVKLFQLRSYVPQPASQISDEKYRAILEYLHQNSHHLRDGSELGLSPTYEDSGLSFRQKIPRDSLFNIVEYQLSDSGIWVNAMIPLWRLDEVYDMGLRDSEIRYRCGEMTEKELRTPIMNEDRSRKVFEPLKQKGILIREFGNPLSTWGYQTFDQIDQIEFNHLFRAAIVATPVEDPVRARTLFFGTLGEAQKYMQGLFEQTVNPTK